MQVLVRADQGVDPPAMTIWSHSVTCSMTQALEAPDCLDDYPKGPTNLVLTLRDSLQSI